MICALCDKPFDAKEHRQRRVYCSRRCTKLAVATKTRFKGSPSNNIPKGIRQKISDQRIVHPGENKYR